MLLALLLTACPEAAQLGRPEQQDAACALVTRAAPQVDRSTLARLLEEPEFARSRERNANALVVLWEQFLAWLKRVFQTDEAATFARAAPFAVLTLAFAVALLAALRFARSRPAEPSRAPTPAPASALGLKPAPQHFAAARALLVSAPREALREALLGLLSALERRRLALPDRVKTNRELCAELPARGADPALTAEISARLDWYDRAFYSLGQVSTDDARAFLEQVEGLASK
ncbi:MAG: DUF4129 domain-containing protein [Archangiaceae bacterium]|nr:DUF4129 domain-containing protein [Archangiaceae bacterium]